MLGLGLIMRAINQALRAFSNETEQLNFFDSKEFGWVFISITIIVMLVCMCGAKQVGHKNFKLFRDSYNGRTTYDVMADEKYNRLLTLFDTVFARYSNNPVLPLKTPGQFWDQWK